MQYSKPCSTHTSCKQLAWRQELYGSNSMLEWSKLLLPTTNSQLIWNFFCGQFPFEYQYHQPYLQLKHNTFTLYFCPATGLSFKVSALLGTVL